MVIDVAKMKLGRHLSEIQELEGKANEGEERLKEIEALHAAAEEDRDTIAKLQQEVAYLERDIERLREAASGRRVAVPTYSHKAVWACPRTRNAREQTDKVHLVEAADRGSGERPREEEDALEAVHEEATFAGHEQRERVESRTSEKSVGPPETPTAERAARVSAYRSERSKRRNEGSTSRHLSKKEQSASKGSRGTRSK